MVSISICFFVFVIGLIVGEVLGVVFSNYIIVHLRKAEQAGQELVRTAHNNLAQAVHLLREHLQQTVEKAEDIKDDALADAIKTLNKAQAAERSFIGAGVAMKKELEDKFQEVGKKL